MSWYQLKDEYSWKLLNVRKRNNLDTPNDDKYNGDISLDNSLMVYYGYTGVLNIIHDIA